MNDSIPQNNPAGRILLIKRASIVAFFTLLILVLFQPFGTYQSDYSYKFLRLSGYGLVTFCAMLLAGMAELCLNRFNINNRLKLLLTGLSYILLVAVFNHSYFVVAVLGYWSWFPMWMHIFMNAAYGVFGISGGAVGQLDANLFRATAIILSLIYIQLMIYHGNKREVTLKSLWKNKPLVATSSDKTIILNSQVRII